VFVGNTAGSAGLQRKQCAIAMLIEKSVGDLFMMMTIFIVILVVQLMNDKPCSI
jgi:hypothetical protein